MRGSKSVRSCEGRRKGHRLETEVLGLDEVRNEECMRAQMGIAMLYDGAGVTKDTGNVSMPIKPSQNICRPVVVVHPKPGCSAAPKPNRGGGDEGRCSVVNG